MTPTPEWLEYGAFGLLAVVLLVIGYLAREFVNRFMERQKSRENHAAEVDLVEVRAMVARVERQDAFMRDLMAQDREDRNQQQAVMADLVAKDIEVKGELVATLQSLCNGQEALCHAQEEHEKQANERHIRVIEALGQLRP